MLKLKDISGFKDVVREVELRESPLVAVDRLSDKQKVVLQNCGLAAGDNFFISLEENQLVMPVYSESGVLFSCRFVCNEKQMKAITEYQKFGVSLVAAVSNLDLNNNSIIADIYAFFHHLSCGNSAVVVEDKVLNRIRERFGFALDRKKEWKKDGSEDNGDNEKWNESGEEEDRFFDFPSYEHLLQTENSAESNAGVNGDESDIEASKNMRQQDLKPGHGNGLKSPERLEDDYGFFFSVESDSSDLSEDNDRYEFGIFGGAIKGSSYYGSYSTESGSGAVSEHETPEAYSSVKNTTDEIPIESFTADDQKNNFGSVFTLKISGKYYFAYSLPYDHDFNYVDKYEEKRQKSIAENQLKKSLKKAKKDEQDEAEGTDVLLKESSKETDVTEERELADRSSLPSFILENLQPQCELRSVIESTHRAFTAVSSDLKMPMYFKSYDENTELLTTRTAIFSTQSCTARYGIAEGLLFFISGRNFEKYRQRLALGRSAAVFRNLVSSGESYLGRWELYSRYEFRQELSRMADFGLIRITAVSEIPGGYRLFLSPQFQLHRALINQNDEIMVIGRGSVSALESEKQDTESVISYTGTGDIRINISDFESEEWARFVRILYKENKKNIFQLKSDGGNVVDLSCHEYGYRPEKGDYLTISSSGTAQAFRRRSMVLEKIQNSDCEMPHLKLLLENSADFDLQLDTLTGNRDSRRIPPLSRRIKEKIFSRNPPTPTQIEAIEIALNTPDIALIQGPPGTGKTTVITAIIERLNEESRDRDIKGQILVSGFQHDAVENIIQRLSINSLPSVKFGEKKSASGSASNQTLHRLENWAENIAAKLRKKHPEIRTSEEENEFNALVTEYMIYPSVDNEIKILKWINGSSNSIILSSREHKEAGDYLRKFTVGDSSNQSLLAAVNRLRTKKSSFLDDGAACCMSLVLRHNENNFLDESDVKLLTEASGIGEQELEMFLPQLEALKFRLLNQLLPPPEFHSPKPKKHILQLIDRVKHLIKRSHQDPNNQENKIVLDFIHDLESDPYSVRHTIEDYQLVYAATTQQSLGADIQKAKSPDSDHRDNEALPSYDTVIIDEAARANPSDLLIPMSQARRRIILVGDHRQLPHMVETTVVDAINSDQQIDPKCYEMSMFEYLFHRLQHLTAIDGVRRTITLDSQYRTHPFLGKFVSNYFYESHDPSEAYDSPLPESLFQQNLKWIGGKCCVWFDVPFKFGSTEKTGGGSSRRPVEAKVCAGLIKNWIDSEEGKKLTFGIITFYSAQRDEILFQLSKVGLAEQVDGKYDIAEEYKYLKDGREHLRVGSVDAFQGMEFDIVLLSLVRTADQDELNKMQESLMPEVAKRKAVGFLAMENRLCVSMSRQKKFLGFVGDGGFFNHSVCARAVPSLSAVFKYCSLQRGSTGMIPYTN